MRQIKYKVMMAKDESTKIVHLMTPQGRDSGTRARGGQEGER